MFWRRVSRRRRGSQPACGQPAQSLASETPQHPHWGCCDTTHASPASSVSQSNAGWHATSAGRSGRSGKTTSSQTASPRHHCAGNSRNRTPVRHCALSLATTHRPGAACCAAVAIPALRGCAGSSSSSCRPAFSPTSPRGARAAGRHRTRRYVSGHTRMRTRRPGGLQRVGGRGGNPTQPLSPTPLS